MVENHTNELLEVLPYPGSYGEDVRPLRLPLQQLSHRQSCEYAHHIRYILSPCRPRHHHVPVDQHCCTRGDGCFRQHDYDKSSGYRQQRHVQRCRRVDCIHTALQRCNESFDKGGETRTVCGIGSLLCDLGGFHW